MNKKSNYFFSVTETSRLTGIDKKGIYNRCMKGIPLGPERRKGRKFDEAVIPFEGIVAMCPEFANNTFTKILSLFSLENGGGFAFRINEATRILGLSNQWIHKKIKEGNVATIVARRNYRVSDEKLIHWSHLSNLKQISFDELRKRVLELFELSWRFIGKNAYHSCRVGIGEFRAGRENGKFVCPNCLARR